MIHYWFPKTIYYKNNIQIENLHVYRNFILNNICVDKFQKTDLKKVNSSHKVFDALHKKNIFNTLSKIIIEECYSYLNDLGFLNREIYIDKMWTNVSGNGDYIFPHNHNGSFISGVFYVSSNPENKIKFFNMPTMFPDPDVWNINNYQYCEYSCIPGTLLLFQSDFIHGTGSQIGDEKISLSFNIKIK